MSDEAVQALMDDETSHRRRQTLQSQNPSLLLLSSLELMIVT